ncbi:NB-ARC domain-containing protein [Favolaschia claudopus]|uniref:NB-ARC domain-containing protein n=1 Tax=Favolaschia claudopus TaxID=2862362 RepID=A0AAW0DP17_9AGAR
MLQVREREFILFVSQSLQFQNGRFQKEKFHRILGQIYKSLCALGAYCVGSDSCLSPRILSHIAEYASSLETFYICLHSQNNIGPLRRFFHQNEITAQLAVNENGLRKAFEAFMAEIAGGATQAVTQFRVVAEMQHEELLELLSLRSNSFALSFSNDGPYFIYHLISSSNSLSLVPACPKVFHGRETELDQIITILMTDSPRVAILGAGGMGKTTLAMAALHSSAVVARYPSRYCISCETSTDCFELVTSLCLHLGVETTSRQLTKIVLRFLRQHGPCLIVLDNFETPWESQESRTAVEEFLSLLAEIPTLGLLVTMRGSERPAGVKWNRPFLPPLEPLSLTSSRQIFVDIAEEPVPTEESALDELLNLSGGLPLALNLLANIASFDGYLGTLERWNIENFMLLSIGNDKGSNLEKSITLSIQSPHILSFPAARDLLSVLSLLPDGITLNDILASKADIPNVRRCQSLLVRLSLAYNDPGGRLKVLSPIREYVRRVYAPSAALSISIRLYFENLLETWRSTQFQHELLSKNLTSTLLANLGNIHELLLAGLITDDKATLKAVGRSIIILDEFSAAMLRGSSPLSRRLPHLIEVTGDAELRWDYGHRCVRNPEILDQRSVDVELWIAEGAHHFASGTRPVQQAVTFYNAAAWHYLQIFKIETANEFNKQAFYVADGAGDVLQRLSCLETEFRIAHTSGERSRELEIIRTARDLAQFRSVPSLLKCSWLEMEAWVNLHTGNLDRTCQLCTQMEGILIAGGMEQSDRRLSVLGLRAEVHYRKTEYLEARQLYDQILKATSPTSSPRHHANALSSTAHLDLLTGGDTGPILTMINAAEAICKTLDSSSILACQFTKTYLDMPREGADASRAEFLHCLGKSRGSFRDVQTHCLAVLGDYRLQLYDATETFRWAATSLAFVQQMRDVVGTMSALRCLADVLFVLGDEETALALFHVALGGGDRIGIHRLKAECLVGIGDIMMRRGDRTEAEKMWTDARLSFLRCTRINDATAVEVRLLALNKGSAA